MLNRIIAAALLMTLVAPAVGQEPYEGVNLISLGNSYDTNLLDMDGNVIKIWHGSQRPKSFAYMLPDSTIVRPCKADNDVFTVNTAGGRIQMIDAADVIVWDYVFSDSTRMQHHDIEPMPNGNVLILAWELVSLQDALDMGVANATGDLWPTLIAEVEPVGATDGNIVWEWHNWDHLIQDVDPAGPNYGVVADHPELLDMNSVELGTSGDWVHENSIDYNPELDQVILSSRKTSEFYIIDHSTTTEEAAGHTGGNSGMGGDFLYRWGNPQVYGRGTTTDQFIDIAHAVNWIDEGLPGAGNVLIFDNGNSGYSVVYEITPPVEPDGTYTLETGLPYGPADATWSYGGPGGFYGGASQCGAFRLPNGNTLITSTGDNYIFEVTVDGTTVWDYTAAGSVKRALRYWDADVGVEPDGVSERTAALSLAFPNPFNPKTTLAYSLDHEQTVELAVYNLRGELVAVLDRGERSAGEHKLVWDGTDATGDQVSSGAYFVRLTTETSEHVNKVMLLK